MKNGILTSNSTGNSGPAYASILNVSPWSLSVAASTIDRKFVTKVKLGNGKGFEGVSVNPFQLEDKIFSLIYGADAPNVTTNISAHELSMCGKDSLDKEKVQGKLVFCEGSNDRGEETLVSGAVGTIMESSKHNDFANVFPLPAALLNMDDGSAGLQYLRSTRNPEATIEKSIGIKDSSAPFVVSFSSKGPNPISMDILKPDLTAPGVNILAAWFELTSVSTLGEDKRVVPYNIMSGTSM